MKPPLTPPLKCQGIKTKLVSEIRRLIDAERFDRWIEPFCGSCVVALNVQPKRAILSDSNLHIIRLYQQIQSGKLTPSLAKEFLSDEGEKLRTKGETHYYEVRERFNSNPTSLEFLFLNRSCFNGVIRFNRHGKFNVPYGHKPERFARAYITKIANQIKRLFEVSSRHDWTFTTRDFRETLSDVGSGDIIYADPPYAGRHVDYYNTWSQTDEVELANLLKALRCRFILSTWHGNKFRTNEIIEQQWSVPEFHLFTRQHFYHVGSTEELRHPMVEALITNFPVPLPNTESTKPVLRSSSGLLFDLTA